LRLSLGDVSFITSAARWKPVLAAGTPAANTGFHLAAEVMQETSPKGKRKS